MIEALLQEARELIEAGDYDAARILLEAVDDAVVRALLDEMDARKEEGSTRFTYLEAADLSSVVDAGE
jgi:Mg/Co/Ni transporter MgtE